MTEPKNNLQALGTYLDGKIKRYNLMFAVNGGVFALAKLMKTPGSENLLGNVKLPYLAFGAVLFTFILWFDIWLWGEMMRRDYFDGKIVFQKRGKTILCFLSSLLILGWLAAVFDLKITLLLFGALVFVGWEFAYDHYLEEERKSRANASRTT